MGRCISDDRVAAVAVLLMSAAGGLALKGVPFHALEAGLGPAFFPAVLLSALAVLGFLLLGRAIVQRHSGNRSEPQEEDTGHSLYGIGVLVGYAILFRYFGCLIATEIALVVSMLLLRVTWWRAIVFAAGVTGVIYMIFALAFGVRF